MDWLLLLADLSGNALVGRLNADDPTIRLDLRDEACARCGKPTRYSTPAADGVPTCAACRDALQKPRPREGGRRCPGDDAELQLEVVSNVAVDRCPSCAGVWLDAGELEVVTKAAVRSATRDTKEAEDLLATVIAGLPRRRTPPAR